MKIGRTLSEVAAEIERQAQTKHGYIADTGQLRLDDDGHTLALDGQTTTQPYLVDSSRRGIVASEGPMDLARCNGQPALSRHGAVDSPTLQPCHRRNVGKLFL